MQHHKPVQQLIDSLIPLGRIIIQQPLLWKKLQELIQENSLEKYPKHWIQQNVNYDLPRPWGLKPKTPLWLVLLCQEEHLTRSWTKFEVSGKYYVS